MGEMKRLIKRRTLRRIRANMWTRDYQNVYVVLLDNAVDTESAGDEAKEKKEGDEKDGKK